MAVIADFIGGASTNRYFPAESFMNSSKQKYSIYRDNDLIASDLLSLPSIMKFVRNDALKEHSQGRPAHYMITGSLGFKRTGSHLRGRVVWDGIFSEPVVFQRQSQRP